MEHKRSSNLQRLLAQTLHGRPPAPGAARHALHALNGSHRSRAGGGRPPAGVRAGHQQPAAHGHPRTSSSRSGRSDEVVRVTVATAGRLRRGRPPAARRRLGVGPVHGRPPGGPLGRRARTAAPRSGSSFARRPTRATARRSFFESPPSAGAQATTAGGSGVTSGGVWRSRSSRSWSTFSKKRSTSRGSKCWPRSSRMISTACSRGNALR